MCIWCVGIPVCVVFTLSVYGVCWHTSVCVVVTLCVYAGVDSLVCLVFRSSVHMVC